MTNHDPSNFVVVVKQSRNSSECFTDFRKAKFAGGGLSLGLSQLSLLLLYSNNDSYDTQFKSGSN